MVLPRGNVNKKSHACQVKRGITKSIPYLENEAFLMQPTRIIAREEVESPVHTTAI